MLVHSCAAPDKLLRSACESMLLEMNTGAEGTAAGYAEFTRLEREWISSQSGGGEIEASALRYPRHSIESFIAFTHWLVTEAGRGRSFATIMRSAGGVMSKLSLENWTTHKRVKAVFKELERTHGVEVEPCTAVTRRLLSLMLDRTIKAQCKSSERIEKRTKVLLVLEVMGGVRVGEACGGGDGHGALAPNLSIMRPVGESSGGPGEVCELYLEDSKTGFPRYVNFVGVSRGVGIRAADHVRALWRDSGWQIEEFIEDGMVVQRPDYSVVRVSFMGMGDAEFKALRGALQSAEAPREILLHSKTSLEKAEQRRSADGVEEERRYVNVAGGARLGREVTSAVKWLKSAGLSSFVNVVGGPLLRATVKKGQGLAHMPLVPSSSYTHLIGALKSAYEISRQMDTPDLELDLNGMDTPKLAHHSFRRGSDKMAREAVLSEEVTGVTELDVDEQFGWKQKEHRQNQQIHYAGRRQRSVRAKVTMNI